MIDFENIEQKLADALSSDRYQQLVTKVKNAKHIYLIGNGGLHFVACHAATDMSRLIPYKAFYSFDSVGFITSNANDHGYENMFLKWIECMCEGINDPTEVLIIGLSCSGKSKNIHRAIDWGKAEKMEGCQYFLITGKDQGFDYELSLDCKWFHTTEILTLMIFYDLIMQCGHRCPSIDQEVQRKWKEKHGQKKMGK